MNPTLFVSRGPGPAGGRRRGFTLIELLAVMAIIAVLATMIAGVTRYAKRSALVARARADLEKIRNVLEEYHLEKGAYPSRLEDIESRLPEDVDLTDPWDRPYVYTYRPTVNENTYTLYSKGPRADIEGDDIK